jgi:hypothetical protein
LIRLGTPGTIPVVGDLGGWSRLCEIAEEFGHPLPNGQGLILAPAAWCSRIGSRTTSGGAPGTIRVADVFAGLSRALDITEGHPQGHAARSCIIGMRIAALLGLGETDRTDLSYAWLLKDAGCSSNAARVYQLFGGDDHSAKRAHNATVPGSALGAAFSSGRVTRRPPNFTDGQEDRKTI